MHEEYKHNEVNDLIRFIWSDERLTTFYSALFRTLLVSRKQTAHGNIKITFKNTKKRYANFDKTTLIGRIL